MAAGVGEFPGWVAKPRSVVERVEEFLCWMTAETRSPSVTHAWFGSRWARGVAGELAPVTLVVCEPRLRRAMADLEVGAELHRRSSYSPVSWFAEQGIPGCEVPSASWWANTSGWGYGQDAVLGGVSVIAWLVGGMDDIGGLVPRFYEDGTRIPRELRSEWRGVLVDLEFAPRRHPAVDRPLSPESVRQACRNSDGGPRITASTARWAPRSVRG